MIGIISVIAGVFITILGKILDDRLLVEYDILNEQGKEMDKNEENKIKKKIKVTYGFGIYLIVSGALIYFFM